ncbi:hypothetical protein [Amycolatopsis taiwanensis]|uniref:hypothetical protein n=1 Tax=Amycolatopsis taiwanensis TaxID=342230 RepID=UPI0004AE216D|nr:hypothetical protein [Amycolatopsis taiwanensis]
MEIDFMSDAPRPGDLGIRWIHGSPSARRNTDPPIQVHAYDPHTFVLCQNKAVHFEAPFLYLFFGNERALLLDTGATADPDRFPLRATVDTLLGEWLASNRRYAYELVVAHTHAHGDHVAGDAQFDGHPATIVMPPDTVADLRAVRDAAVSVAARPGVHVFDEFIIFHGRCRSARRRHFARLLRSRLRNGLVGLRWRSDSASISVNRRPVAPSQNSPA